MVTVEKQRPKGPQKIGQRLEDIIKVTFDSSYLTGGEPLDLPKETGIKNITHVNAEISNGGYQFRYDRANKKLIALYSDANNASDAPLVEVPNATDLSAQVTYLHVIGY